MKRIIKKIGFHDEYGNPQTTTLGKYGVKEIHQHCAQGEGDKFYYEVILENNKGFITFDPKLVDYEDIEE